LISYQPISISLDKREEGIVEGEVWIETWRAKAKHRFITGKIYEKI
jgi:hypothetical protein